MIKKYHFVDYLIMITFLENPKYHSRPPKKEQLELRSDCSKVAGYRFIYKNKLYSVFSNKQLENETFKSIIY